jgi:hypothetical protein
VWGRNVKDIVEAIVEIISSWTGYHAPSATVPYLILFMVGVPTIISLRLAVMRMFGNVRAISGELEAAAQLITAETRDKLALAAEEINGKTREKLEHAATRLEAALRGHFDQLQSAFGELKTEVTSLRPDGDIASETVASPRKTRARLAQAARDSAMQKWLEGRDFQRSADDPNIYVYKGVNEIGNVMDVQLTTPYRANIGDDGRMAFALDVWVDGYKKMNFEWDLEGGYALRGFRKDDGRWVEELSNWDLRRVEARSMAIVA